jgi:hypothetical protein
MPFRVHEAGEAITRGEHRSRSMPVLPRSPGDVVRYADIERADRLIGYDVNPAASHLAMFAGPWLRKGERRFKPAGVVAPWRDSVPLRMARTKPAPAKAGAGP